MLKPLRPRIGRSSPVEAREREVGLRLDADGREHVHAACAGGGVVEESRLADSRLAADHQRSALAG